jgi:hypothetical protein
VILGTSEEYLEGRGNIGDQYIQYCIGHSRDKRDRNKRDYTPFHTQSSTELELEDRENINSDTEAEIERSMGDRRETSEGRGKGPKIHPDSTQTILNDLAGGKRDMMNSIAQIDINTQMIQHSLNTIGANAIKGTSVSREHQGGGASGSSGSQGGVSGHP